MGAPQQTFAGGGGLGDAVFILNKFQQLANPACDRLIFVTEQASAERLVADFFNSQEREVEIRRVPSNNAAIRALRRSGAKILNTSWPGWPWLMPWLLRDYPFDAVLQPRMEFRVKPYVCTTPYFLVQTNAGTLKYGSGKNWQQVQWINQFIQAGRSRGLACILTGTENPGIVGADETLLGLPMDELLGLIQGARFVLGLQGFVTIVALLMGRKVLLKRENWLVVAHHIHLSWIRRSQLTLFSESHRPGDRFVRKLLLKAGLS
jgi:hypothetical protein